MNCKPLLRYRARPRLRPGQVRRVRRVVPLDEGDGYMMGWVEVVEVCIRGWQKGWWRR